MENYTHYPTRKFVTELNNILLLNKIKELKRCVKTDVQDLYKGEINGLKIEQVDFLFSVINSQRAYSNIINSSDDNLDVINRFYNSL